MSGQPQIAGVLNLDVTKLEISSSAPPIWNPTTIVEKNETFYLGATFNGEGFVWEWLKNWATQYKVSYFAEGIGKIAPEVDLGATPPLSLTSANEYSPADTRFTVPGGTLEPGVYHIACVVTFIGAPGLTGYHENLVIQVY